MRTKRSTGSTGYPQAQVNHTRPCREARYGQRRGKYSTPRQRHCQRPDTARRSEYARAPGFDPAALKRNGGWQT